MRFARQVLHRRAVNPAFNKENRIKSLRWVIVLALVIVLKPPYKKADAAPVNLNKQDVQTVKAPAESKTKQPQIVEAVAQTSPPEPVPEADIPELVFCGSPMQRTTKRPVRANVLIGRVMAAQRGWTGGEWTALLELYSCESSWNNQAGNPDSGACGIPQSWPCSKLSETVPDWRNNVAGQLTWGYDYLQRTYGAPSNALAHHYRANWY